jgi:hypothetical protein
MDGTAPAWMLSLDGRWTRCTAARRRGTRIVILDAAEGIESGMSGSPVVSEHGLALGVIGTGGKVYPSGHQAYLRFDLPGWLALPPR